MLTRRYASAPDLDGVSGLERLRSGSPTSLERDAAGFLELTWPSSDVHALVRGLSKRFNGGPQFGVPLGVSSWGVDPDGDANAVGGAGAGDLTACPLR